MVLKLGDLRSESFDARYQRLALDVLLPVFVIQFLVLVFEFFDLGQQSLHNLVMVTLACAVLAQVLLAGVCLTEPLDRRTGGHGVVESPLQLISFLLKSFVLFRQFLVLKLVVLQLLDCLFLLHYLCRHSFEVTLSPNKINLVHVVLDLVQVLLGGIVSLDELSSLFHYDFADLFNVSRLSVWTLGVFLALSLLAETDDLVSFVHLVGLHQRLPRRTVFSKLVSLKHIEQGFFLGLLDGFAIEGNMVDFADRVLVMVE